MNLPEADSSSKEKMAGIQQEIQEKQQKNEVEISNLQVPLVPGGASVFQDGTTLRLIDGLSLFSNPEAMPYLTADGGIEVGLSPVEFEKLREVQDKVRTDILIPKEKLNNEYDGANNSRKQEIYKEVVVLN